MIVTFVSECEKKALIHTRRVLDAFANRIGSRTWQTVITEDGLQAVKKLLRKSASKNTAVSCHWLHSNSRNRSELAWIVGNRSKFNALGIVPVNTTQQDLLSHNEYDWQNTEVIAVFAAIAGLFHDFGKANKLFQNKLKKDYHGKRFEPYRHEWVSLKLFQAFVGEQKDIEWLELLKNINEKYEDVVLNRLTDLKSNPFIDFDDKPIAKLVAWLIVSHHRLPQYNSSANENNSPSFENINEWVKKEFNSNWNSRNNEAGWKEQELLDNWRFPNNSGTPILSKTWREEAKRKATQALACHKLIAENYDWFNHRFTAHISRLVLMLSDHCYSASDATKKWQDKNYLSYANTDKETKSPKQHLDEHNIGVAVNAYSLAKKLPKLKSELPNLGYNADLINPKPINNSNSSDFDWQKKSYKLAETLKEESESYGFFGINMASTGKGKTFANARIMYGLSDNPRFNIALGLRTLTLQTASALRKLAQLDKDQLALIIGSQSVKSLYELNQTKQAAPQDKNIYTNTGSESAEELFLESIGVIYDGFNEESILAKWLQNSPKLHKLIQAPVVVSTIDHLIPATEGTRGGKQIAPMLRLLTSDLILDEPDDFALSDLPALCRLVNWAGVLGAKVLISTATLPPAQAYALFEAYQSGRKDYSLVNGDKGQTEKVCCAWFDEFNQYQSSVSDIQTYIKEHNQFVNKRIEKLLALPSFLRKAKLINTDTKDSKTPIETMSELIYESLHTLHNNNHQYSENGKKVSIGLVKIANIKPLVAIARKLFTLSPKENYRIHYCIYHSQFPLAVRSKIEEKLDSILNRKNPNTLWLETEIKNAIINNSEENQVFIVLATSVAEIGRDHDYDWAVAEPSSMRSLIQLSGRIQRHRQQQPKMENLHILSKNYRGLKDKTGKNITFYNPGFESIYRKLNKHDLTDILREEQYIKPNSISSIEYIANVNKNQNNEFTNFVEMEQRAYFQKLLGQDNQKNCARLWWKNNITWCGELQRQQPFRKSKTDQPYCLYLDNVDNQAVWKIKNEDTRPVEYEKTADIKQIKNIVLAERCQFWFNLDIVEIYQDLELAFEEPLSLISKKYGEVRLDSDNNNYWYYHPQLGVFDEI